MTEPQPPTRGELLACEAIVRNSGAETAQQLADALHRWYESLPTTDDGGE